LAVRGTRLTGERRRLHNEDLYVLHSSSNIQVMNSRRMRWAGHMAHMGEKESAYGDLVRNLRERDNMEDPGIDGRIILRWSFKKWDRGHGRD
jgi:hypothetical protein